MQTASKVTCALSGAGGSLALKHLPNWVLFPTTQKGTSLSLQCSDSVKLIRRYGKNFFLIKKNRVN